MTRPAIVLLGWAALLAVAAAGTASGQPTPPVRPARPPSTQPANPLIPQLRLMMAQGQLTEALTWTDKQLKAAPKDPNVVAVYAELRMAIARQAIAAQKFQQAEQLLKQIVAAQPEHPSAGKMLKVIADSRAGIDQSLADAEQLLRLERFEQAAAILAQVAGLVPDQPQRWKQSWLLASIGAADDHYLMRNYESALPFYSQAMALGAADSSSAEALAWRWSHCYAMNLARTANLHRPAAQWIAIIEQAKDTFNVARADTLGHFMVGLGRHDLGEFAEAAVAYRHTLGGNGPPPQADIRQECLALRTKATEYVDSLNRSNLLDRRTGAWALALPGDPVVRKADGLPIAVSAANDLVARRVLEAITYHAPRLVAYLGGTEADLKFAADYNALVQAKGDAETTDLFVPSYTRIQSSKGTLLKHWTVFIQSDPLLLGATVPHELCHVLTSKLAGYPPVPLALDEGLAIHAETTARYLMFHRAVADSGGAVLTVAQLLAAEKLPPVGQRARFYGECYNLVAWLMTRGKPSKVIDLCRLTARLAPADALLKVYEFPDLATAEKAYRTFLEDQGLARRAAGK